VIDASIIKQLKAQLAERMQNTINIKLFSRDQITIEASIPPELLAEGRSTVQALPEPTHAETSQAEASHPELSVVIPNAIRTIIAWDLKGSRAHVEFVLLNNTDQLLAIRNVVLLVGSSATPDALYFKQFVDVKADARLPSDERLPVVVLAKSGLHLCAELQGPIDVKLGSADRECSLVVELNDQHVSSRFTAQGSSLTGALLDELERDAKERKVAVALALPISLIRA
jgi:hypothetical protein